MFVQKISKHMLFVRRYGLHMSCILRKSIPETSPATNKDLARVQVLDIGSMELFWCLVKPLQTFLTLGMWNKWLWTLPLITLKVMMRNSYLYFWETRNQPSSLRKGVAGMCLAPPPSGTFAGKFWSFRIGCAWVMYVYCYPYLYSVINYIKVNVWMIGNLALLWKISLILFLYNIALKIFLLILLARVLKVMWESKHIPKFLRKLLGNTFIFTS